MIKKAFGAVVIVAVAVVAATALGYSGVYNTAADAPHWGVTSRVLATIRDRSIAVRTDTLKVPNLADPALIALGAEHYAGMCTGCHLAPGMGENEMREGLYPKPPDLAQRRDRGPAEQFWIIKHGIKMSGMPAWGVTHDDKAIWGLVAFLQRLPALDAAGYAALTGEAGGADHDPEQHEHGRHDHYLDSAGNGDDGPAAAAGATMDAITEAHRLHVHTEGEHHDH